MILTQRFVGTVGRPRAIGLTGRPYCAADSGQRSIGGLREAAKRLAAAGFPRSRLFDLRRELTREALSIDPGTNLADCERVPAEKRLRDWLSHWTKQTRRIVGLGDVWDKAMEDLKAGEDGWFECRDVESILTGAGDESRVTEVRTPLGDLADALALWGRPS